MNIIKYPNREEWKKLLDRPTLNIEKLRRTVVDILKDIRKNGDKAVMEYEEKFDNTSLSSL